MFVGNVNCILTGSNLIMVLFEVEKVIFELSFGVSFYIYNDMGIRFYNTSVNSFSAGNYKKIGDIWNFMVLL